MARTASSPRAALGPETRPARDRCTLGAWRRPESEPCVDGRSPRRKFRRRRVMSGTPPTSVARMWRRPFRVIRDIAGPDRASMGDESTRTGGPRRWRRAVLCAARPIAADLRPRAGMKGRASVLSLPCSGYSTSEAGEEPELVIVALRFAPAVTFPALQSRCSFMKASAARMISRERASSF